MRTDSVEYTYKYVCNVFFYIEIKLISPKLNARAQRANMLPSVRSRRTRLEI